MSSSPNAPPLMSFTDLMALEPMKVGPSGQATDQNRFRSLAAAWAPGVRNTRSYGGHTMAQAVYAASKTVGKGYTVHNVHGNFSLAGLIDRPFIYTVQRIRDGDSFCTRLVTVRQSKEKGWGDAASRVDDASCSGICFTCICSFVNRHDDADEADVDPDYAHRQEESNLREKFRSVLGDKKPIDHRMAPGVDVPLYIALEDEKGLTDPCPGVSVRRVDMAAFNAPLASSPTYTRDYRQLQYYTTIGALPSIHEDPNLHFCAHIYAIDRNSLFAIAYALDIQDRLAKVASISISVIFHSAPRHLAFERPSSEGRSADDQQRWFCQEAGTDRAGSGRALHVSKIWDERGGDGAGARHVASTYQEGLLYVPRKSSSSPSISDAGGEHKAGGGLKGGSQEMPFLTKMSEEERLKLKRGNGKL
ncbi:MAG: hypothetical protein M4579_002655 [Chaenotheca gracillima]|nr:MAG: hypothetical protein M4579_002655 [Chaenotheca gracillima]